MPERSWGSHDIRVSRFEACGILTSGSRSRGCVALNLPVDREDHARLIMGAGCSAASAYVTLDDRAHENAT